MGEQLSSGTQRAMRSRPEMGFCDQRLPVFERRLSDTSRHRGTNKLVTGGRPSSILCSIPIRKLAAGVIFLNDSAANKKISP
jgi:hypothetical protein